MSRFQVKASSGVGAVGGTSRYRLREALTVAHSYRERGFRNIMLVNLATGEETELDQFKQPADDD
jgi:hypothetical protein